MARLYNRRIEILAGPRKITNHEVRFEAVSTLSSDPDEAVVQIYNLSENDRNAIQGLAKNTQVQIAAGYLETGSSVIFTGGSRRVHTMREGPDIITTIECASAYDVRNPARRLDKSYRKGTRLRTVLNDLVNACGAQPGNVGKLYGLPAFAATFRAPHHASGPAWDQLTAFVESQGYRISTQGRRIVVSGIKRSEDLRSVALLSPSTGLIGQPSIDQDGLLTCETLMLPDILPGVLVQLRSEFANGTFKVEKTTHQGSLYGGAFGIRIEGKP